MAGFGGATGGSSAASTAAPVDTSPLDPNILGSNQGQVAFAQAIARLQFAGSDSKSFADSMLTRYGRNIDPAVLQSSGVKMPAAAKWSGSNLWDQRTGSGGSFLGTLANWAGRPVQATMAGLRDVGVSLAKGVHAVTGFGNEPSSENSGFGNIGKALTGHGQMDPFSMVGGVTAPEFAQNFAAGVNRLGLGNVPGAGIVKAAAPAGFLAAAQTGLDPLMGIGGAPSEARAAAGILESTGMGAEAAQVGRSGFGALSPAIQDTARTAITTSPQMGRIAEGAGLIGPGFEDARAALAAKYTNALETGGRSGLRLYGRTVLPREVVSNVANAIPGVEPLRGVVSSALDKLAPVFSNEARLTKLLGPEAAQAIPDIRRVQQAAVNLAAKDAITQFKGFQDLAPAEQAAIARGMERGADYATVVRPTLSPEGQKAMDAFIASRSEDYAAKAVQQFQIDQASMSLAHAPDDLNVVKDEAFAKESARLSDEAQKPILEAEPVAQAARRYADAVQTQLDNVRADFMAKEAQLGKGKAGYGLTKRLGQMEERAAVAAKDAQAAEQKLFAAREDFRLAHSSAATGVSPIDEKATEFANAARDKAAQSGTYLKSEDTYLRHRFTPEGAKLVKQLKPSDPLAQQMLGDLKDLTAGGSLKSRAINAELPDTNQIWMNSLTKQGINVPKDVQILENNMAMLAAHSHVETQAAVEEMRALARLSHVMNAEGTAPLVIAGDTTDAAGNVITAAERAKQLGYDHLDSGIVKGVYAHPDAIPEIKNLSAVTSNDKALRQFQKFFRAWDSQWSRLTTSFSIAKRYIGHQFNSFLAGAGNPEGFVEALRAQQADRAVTAELGRASGADWEQKMVEKLGSRTAEKYFEARKAGIGTTGYMPQNIPNTLEREMGQGGNFNPLSKDFKPLAKLGDMNQAIDNNVRLGHFFNVFEKTGDYKQASDSVYKYLFDYSDLTPTEQKLKQYARFYTYLRKNTPLQVLGMIEKPGVYSTAFRAKAALAKALPADKGPYAQYALEAGGVPTSQGVLGMDMPFEHAVKFATPALQLAAMTPGVGRVLPSSFKPEGGFGEVARNFAGNFAGGPMSAAKVLVEQMTGRSLQSGAPISQDTFHRYWQVLNQLVPVTSKANAVLNPRGGSLPIGVLGKLLNVTVTPINDKTREQELKREARLVSDAIAKFTANQTVIPTTADLQSAGVVPDSAAAKRLLVRAGIRTTQGKVKLTADQKRRAALLKIKVPA